MPLSIGTLSLTVFSWIASYGKEKPRRSRDGAEVYSSQDVKSYRHSLAPTIPKKKSPDRSRGSPNLSTCGRLFTATVAELPQTDASPSSATLRTGREPGR